MHKADFAMEVCSTFCDDLDSSKFFEILNSNTPSYKRSTRQVKITFNQ